MNRKKVKSEISKCLIFVIILSMLFSTLSFAINIEEERKKKTELEKNKKAQEEKVKEIQSKLSQNVKEIASCESEIAKKQDEIANLESEQKNIINECDKQKNELKQKEDETKRIEKVTKERLVQIYENGGNDSLFSILVSSNGVSEFLSNYQLMKEITRMDASMLTSLTQKKEKIEALKKELETKNKLVEENKQKLILLKQEQEKIKNQKRELNSKLTDEEKNQKNIIADFDNKIRQSNALIQSEIAKATQKSNGSKFVGGVFAWPVPSSRYITAGYGDGYAQGYPGYFHTGLDIAAPTGTPAVAANDGTVIYAAFSPYGYGNMVMIDHGGGIFTIYGHGVSIPVGVGQRVSRGQHILNIGSTGYSTGPHLHFEVRQGNRHVNPAPYLY